MIITRTPYRISFFGGGTDYPAHYNDCGGTVFATTIDKYCYINLRYLPPFFKHKHRIVYSKVEEVTEVHQIVHPSVRECLNYVNIQEGLEIHHDGDLPARSGLGSSSSFTVGLLHALMAFQGKMISKNQLAEVAIFVEQEMIKENVGSQDQTMAAYGGLNILQFNCVPGTHVHATPVCIPPERSMEFQDHLMLFFTGIFRFASDVAGEQIKQTPKKKEELQQMGKMVSEAQKILTSNTDIVDFGKLLHESWCLKRSLTKKVTTDTINDIYQKAMNAGAIGGKLLGAGGGGFMLFFVRPEDQERVKQKLGLLHVPFRFEYAGSQIILYEPMVR